MEKSTFPLKYYFEFKRTSLTKFYISNKDKASEKLKILPNLYFKLFNGLFILYHCFEICRTRQNFQPGLAQLSNSWHFLWDFAKKVGANKENYEGTKNFVKRTFVLGLQKIYKSKIVSKDNSNVIDYTNFFLNFFQIQVGIFCDGSKKA